MKILFLALLSVAAFGQFDAQQQNALNVEQSVPFGTVPGQLLILNENLVFVDTQQPGSSLVIPRSGVGSVNVEGSTITVTTSQPVRDRSGNAMRLAFRVLRGDPAAVAAWFNSTADRANSTTAVGADSFEAIHNHTFGECRGRLIASAQQLVYESIDHRDHSRRWEYSAISELNQSNPYEIEIKPTAGGDYKLKLGGQGMDPADFKRLVDRVTAARAGVRR